MAETVAAALFEYAFAEGSFLAFDAAAAISASAAVINTVAIYSASAAYGGYQKRKAASAARDRLNASLTDRLVMTSTAQAARSRVYGRVRNVDGVLFKGTHGTNSEFYTLVIAVAGHEVDAIETIYANDVALSLDVDGYAQTEPYLKTTAQSRQEAATITTAGVHVLAEVPIGGSVSAIWQTGSGDNTQTGTFTVAVVGSTVTLSDGPPSSVTAYISYQVSQGDSYLRVRAYTGASGQNLYSVLEPLVGTQVQSTDHFDGIACLVVTMEFNTDAYPSGVPQFSAVMRGAKINDPRTGTTAWSENPALIARDWALYAYGGGCSSGELNAAAFTAAANACDVSTTFTTDAGSETRPLYQCGMVVPLDANPDEALSEMVEAMAGQWGWAGGALTLRAGVYRAPVATITEDWITDTSEITVVGTSTADLVNVMRATLADAANNYVSAPAAEVRAAAYVTADGRELVREVPLGGVTRAVHAQHVCGVLMREARDGLTVSLPCNLRAYQLELFDVVAVTLPTFGWSAKEMEVLGWEFSATGGISLTLRETAAAIYTPDATFSTLDLSDNTSLPDPLTVAQVAGVSATSSATAIDASIVSRTTISWTAVASQAVRQSGTIEVQYTEAALALPANDWPAAPPVPGSATSTTITGLRSGVYYLLRVRAVNSLGVRGSWSAHAAHEVAGPRAPVTYLQAGTPSGAEDGDLWIDTDANNRQYLRDGGAWVDVRDAGIQAALDAAAAAEALADGKITSYYQAANPGASSEGDLWFDSDDGNRQYVYTGGTWVVAADTRIGTALSDAADAQATADGKVTTFVAGSAPTAEGVGDLWLDSADGNKLRRWNGGSWVLLPIGTGGIDANAATEVYVDTPSGAVTITGEMHTPRGFNPLYTTPMASITFTPGSNGTASIYFEASGQVVNTDPTLNTYAEWSIQDDAGAWDGWKRIGVLAAAPSTTGQFPMSSTRRIAVTGGVSYTFTAYASKLRTADTFTADSIEMRVEVIKR